MMYIKILVAALVLLLVADNSISFINKKQPIEFVYPDGNTKALIMSYDDGPIEDSKLARLFDAYKIIGTFNLNSGYLGTTRGWAQKNADTIYQQYMPIDSMPSVYKNSRSPSASFPSTIE